MAIDPRSRLGRMIQAMAGSRWFARIGPTVVVPIDRALDRVTKGRLTMSSTMLPIAVITTTGRRSGLPRESPLAAVPFDGALFVVGSNFGKPSHPNWTWNLLDEPSATVSIGGERYPATATLLDADEKAATWPRLTERWPLFDLYVERSGRDLRVFRIERD